MHPSTNSENLITIPKPKPATTSAFEGLGNLVHLLPTGTVIIFQFLSPILSNNGECSQTNRSLTGALIVISGLACFLSSFTDSYKDSIGFKRYGIATSTGIWPGSHGQDLSEYRLRIGDFVHAFLCLIVFAALALLDNNSVMCFYPSFGATQKVLIKVLPVVIGPVAGAIFVVFPNRRHGIGFPSTASSPKNGSSTP